MEKQTTAGEVASTDQSKNSRSTACSSTSAPTSRQQCPLYSSCCTHNTGVRACFTTCERIPEGDHRIRIANQTEINALSLGDVTLFV